MRTTDLLTRLAKPAAALALAASAAVFAPAANASGGITAADVNPAAGTFSELSEANLTGAGDGTPGLRGRLVQGARRKHRVGALLREGRGEFLRRHRGLGVRQRTLERGQP